ncbi:hypothetical protein GCM10009550_73370 [Actinocorallia libanotica]|uniref:Uncharacterized protein n=2 Tax=Actinocorallia libanotica TaxID=46162 RepID=A0ABP4CGY5_9ACTN
MLCAHMGPTIELPDGGGLLSVAYNDNHVVPLLDTHTHARPRFGALLGMLPNEQTHQVSVC